MYVCMTLCTCTCTCRKERIVHIIYDFSGSSHQLDRVEPLRSSTSSLRSSSNAPALPCPAPLPSPPYIPNYYTLACIHVCIHVDFVIYMYMYMYAYAYEKWMEETTWCTNPMMFMQSSYSQLSPKQLECPTLLSSQQPPMSDSNAPQKTKTKMHTTCM